MSTPALDRTRALHAEHTRMFPLSPGVYFIAVPVFRLTGRGLKVVFFAGRWWFLPKGGSYFIVVPVFRLTKRCLKVAVFAGRWWFSPEGGDFRRGLAR